MKIIKRLTALMCALSLTLVLAACSSGKTYDTYNIDSSGVVLDSFTKVVGDRAAGEGAETRDASGKLTSLKLEYSGITNPIADVTAYSDYLTTQGFTDYFGADGLILSRIKRQGDGAVAVYVQNTADKLDFTISYIDPLEIDFSDTQYVSQGSSLALLPSNETISFTYPIVTEGLPSVDTVNQLILDGVNSVVQYAKDSAAGQKLSLTGNYELKSALASQSVITLTAQFTVGETTQTLALDISLNDIIGTPSAQYSQISVQ